jgi:hypothetical protein
MLGWVDPKVAIGFLAATLLWICALGWQASYAPTEREKEACYQASKQAAGKTEDCKTLWEKTTTDPVAFFTFVLAISTGGLWLATIGLYIAGRKQIDVAQISANALLDAERPHVLVKDITLSGLQVTPDEYGQIAVSLSYGFQNFGKSPAFLAGITLHLWRGEPGEFSGVPAYGEAGDVGQHIIVVGGTYYNRRPFVSRRYFNPIDVLKVLSGDELFVVYGRISYVDTFGRAHKFRFAYRFVFEGGDASVAISPYGPPAYWETT